MKSDRPSNQEPLIQSDTQSSGFFSLATLKNFCTFKPCVRTSASKGIIDEQNEQYEKAQQARSRGPAQQSMGS